ncbi:M24 family metallopeptidase [Variovorax sp. dw_954]|uniref:M24 family metallopeptidase n=1 Tax=Variovorax sp. dw_954 TaxID=2720078 RepID=UPI002116B358|nr:M24 family metallopeptidase [Variovorax sp. dw_954]
MLPLSLYSPEYIASGAPRIFRRIVFMLDWDQVIDRREKVGPWFSLAGMHHARAQSLIAVDRIAAAIRPGMTTLQACEAASDVLGHMGMQRTWHRTIVCFGPDTLKKFGEPADPAQVLGTDDIFFVDIGPVWDGHEGDAGDTFVVGSGPDMQACARAARTLWHEVAARWRRDRLSGQALYAYATKQVESMGWRLNHEIKGHRLGDFPHAIHKAGRLGDFESCPSIGLWVLEIQIAHPVRPFGAFYEDLLIEDHGAANCGALP